jgi:WD40 repeat protein
VKPLKIGPSLEVAFSESGERLAALSSRHVSVWDLTKRSKVARSHPFSHPSSVDFSPDGTKLAAKSTSGHIAVISAESGKTVMDFKNTKDGEGSNLRYSACGEYLIDGSWGGVLSVRRADTGAREFLREFRDEQIRSIQRFDGGKRWIVSHIRKWTPAMSDDDILPPGYFSIWEWPFRIGGDRTFLELAFPESSAVTSDGELLAVVQGPRHDSLSVFEVATGARVAGVQIERGALCALAWSPDKRRIGSVQEKKIVFYAYPGLKKLSEVHLAYASDIAFSPNGRFAALGSWDLGWVFSTEDLATSKILLKQKPRKRGAAAQEPANDELNVTVLEEEPRRRE